MEKQNLIYLINNLMEDFDPYEYEAQADEYNILEYIEDTLDNDPKAIKDYCDMVLDECEDYDITLKARRILKEIA
jgi:hypothetical protein